MLLDTGDSQGPVAGGEGTALRRSRAHVTRGENAGERRLELARLSLRPPTRIALDARASEDVAEVIQRDGLREPFGVRCGADEDEKPGAINRLLFSRNLVS